MDFSPEKDMRHASMRWCVYIPDEDLEYQVLDMLFDQGYEASPVVRLWRGKESPMFDIPWDGAKLIAKKFPNPKYLRVILRADTRGWSHWKAESRFDNPLVRYSNNEIFNLQFLDRITRSIPVRKRA